METKHTKGNWTAKGIYIMMEGKTGSQGQAFRQMISKPPNTQHVPCEEDYEALSNAKLMAASPDLLEACTQVIDEYEKFYKNSPDFLSRSNLDALRFAIKKATE
jgi:hypothetical protein